MELHVGLKVIQWVQKKCQIGGVFLIFLEKPRALLDGNGVSAQPRKMEPVTVANEQRNNFSRLSATRREKLRKQIFWILRGISKSTHGRAGCKGRSAHTPRDDSRIQFRNNNIRFDRRRRKAIQDKFHSCTEPKACLHASGSKRLKFERQFLAYSFACSKLKARGTDNVHRTKYNKEIQSLLTDSI